MDQKSIQTRLMLPHYQKEIIVYQYGDSTRKILLAHGWSGRGTQLAVMAEKLLKAGYAVVSFDAPAHGRAAGKTSMMPHFVEAIEVIQEKYGPFDALIGHSLGGMAALKAVAQGLQVRKLAIIGTANSITHITREFARNMKMNDRVAEKMKNYLDNKFGVDMDTYSGAVSAKSVKIPTLIVHDEDDVDVHISAAHEINAELEQGQLYLTSGLGHRRILGDPEVINKIVAFLSE